MQKLFHFSASCLGLFKSRCQFSDFLSSLNQDLADGGIHVDVGRVLLSASSTSKRVGGEGEREVEELGSYSFKIPTI